MIFSLSSIIHLLTTYKYLLLFLIMIIEGPIITVIAGSLVSLGKLNFFISYVLIVAGDLTGDSIYYCIGRFGRKKFLGKWGKYLGFSTERVIKIEKHFDKHSGKTLFLGKISHGIGAIFLVAAGIAEMPFSKFIGFNFIATVIKSLILFLIGFYFGQAIFKINSVFQTIALVSAGIGLAVLFVYLLYGINKKDKKYERPD